LHLVFFLSIGFIVSMSARQNVKSVLFQAKLAVSSAAQAAAGPIAFGPLNVRLCGFRRSDNLMFHNRGKGCWKKLFQTGRSRRTASV
jgi:hypothetical protein